MAELNKTVLGRLSGAVGDVIFRQRNGKNFVGTKPSPFMPGTDAASVLRRAKFALSIKLAKTINSMYQVKSVWKPYTPSGLSPFNYMIKANYPNIEDGNLSDFVTLVPDIGFGINASSVTISSSEVRVDIDPLGNATDIDPVVELSLQLCSILFLNNPIDNNVKDYDFLSMVSASQTLSLDTALSFSIPFSNLQTQIFDKYQNHKSYFTLLSFNSDSSVVHYSNTFIG
jgi:hypothetical protein